jgi:hypothetical protein
MIDNKGDTMSNIEDMLRETFGDSFKDVLTPTTTATQAIEAIRKIRAACEMAKAKKGAK